MLTPPSTTPIASQVPEILKKALTTSKTEKDTASISWLLYGEVATGKTHDIFTARQPIYVQSFDPKGSDLPIAHKLVMENKAIIDRSCEVEDAKKPTAFEAFEKNFKALHAAKAFDSLGTYAIDSLTFLTSATMNHILSKSGRAMTVPQQQDYYNLQAAIQNVIMTCCNLPCDFILTAHMDKTQDNITNEIITALLATGKSQTRLPRYFSEFYATDVIYDDKQNPVYRLLTKPNKRYRARTRIGSGVFDQYEIPDLMALRLKAGRGVDHLPPLA